MSTPFSFAKETAKAQVTSKATTIKHPTATTKNQQINLNEVDEMDAMDEVMDEAEVRTYNDLPDGTYQAQVEEFSLTTARTSGVPMFKFVLTVINGNYAGRKEFLNYTIDSSVVLDKSISDDDKMKKMYKRNLSDIKSNIFPFTGEIQKMWSFINSEEGRGQIAGKYCEFKVKTNKGKGKDAKGNQIDAEYRNINILKELLLTDIPAIADETERVAAFQPDDLPQV